MTAFQTPIDIANRALQHLGSTRIDPTLGFTENSRNASEIASCYDKLRRAELQANVWTFATRRAVLRSIDANTMLLVAAMWSTSVTYYTGSIVSDDAGNLWISRIGNNLGNDPQGTSTWERYFGPVTVSLYDATVAYYAGELVYTASGNGTSRVYLSLQSSNSDVPGTATPWAATTTFFKNQVVTYLSTAYMSLIDLNTNNVPSAAPALFNIATTYALGASVGGSDGIIYTSLANGNVGHDPTTDVGVHWTNTGVLNPWTTVFVGGAGSDKWLEIGGTEFPNGVGLTTLNIIYPIGSGPSTQTSTRNLFRLPNGWLRECSQAPKSGAANWLGGPSGIGFNDWVYEGGYLVSGDTGPIVLRFVADMSDVTRMGDMFCEGLAARIALSICDLITQSNAQLGSLAKVYSEWVDRAKTRNGIEAGADEPPMDDYIAVRF